MSAFVTDDPKDKFSFSQPLKFSDYEELLGDPGQPRSPDYNKNITYDKLSGLNCHYQHLKSSNW